MKKTLLLINCATLIAALLADLPFEYFILPFLAITLILIGGLNDN